MSLAALAGGAGGTGTVTVTAPVTNNNRNLTLPDGDGTLVATGFAQTFTAAQTFNAKTTMANTLKVEDMLEKVTITAAAPTATTNFDCLAQGIQYFTTNAANNWTLNIRGDASNSLDSQMAVGESMTFTMMAAQGATPYYPTAHQIDGSAKTPLWAGGTAPTSGDANSVNIYSYTVIKTGAATFTLLASKSRYA